MTRPEPPPPPPPSASACAAGAVEPDQLPADLAALLADCVDQRAHGDLTGAARSAEAAWASVESAAPSALSRANTLLIRGLLAGDAGDYEAARRLLDEAAATAASATGRSAARLEVGAMTALGSMYRARGDYVAAETQLRAALDRAEAVVGLDATEVAAALNERGMVLRYTGRFDDAAACYERARRILERELGPSHPELATIHHNLAGLAQARGDLAAAEPAARHAVALREDALGPDHVAVAADRGVLAAVLLARGFPGEAAALLRSILAVFERTYGPEHHEVAVVLHNLGTASHAAGRPGPAAELLTRSLAIKERVLGPDHPELAATLCNLGVIQHKAGHTAAAAGYYARASRILRATVQADHPTLRICEDALAALAAKGSSVSQRWPAMMRAMFEPIDADPPADHVRRLTLVPFLTDGRCVLIEKSGGPALPSGEVADGEDYVLDTVLRIPLETAGFRYQRFHPFGLDGDHLYAWIEGAPYTGNKPHRSVPLIFLPAQDAAERVGDPALASAILAALGSYRSMSEQDFHADNGRTLAPAYLRGTTPQEGSGFGGGPGEWRQARHHITEAIDSDGTFLDVGCANGLLMESAAAWCAERGLKVEPYGVDISPKLAELARRRLPQWADRIWAGNAADWQPPDRERFGYVHILLDCVPRARRADLIRHHLTHTVQPGTGRLLVSDYAADPATGHPAAPETARSLGFRVAGQTSGGDRPGRAPSPTAWIIAGG